MRCRTSPSVAKKKHKCVPPRPRLAGRRPRKAPQIGFPVRAQRQDMAVLVASDGIWQVITPQQAAGIVARFPADSAMEAAGALADEAVRRWFARSQGQVIDDVTVVIAYLARRSRAPSEDLASTMSLLSSPCSEVSGPSDGTSAPPTPAA